MAWHSNSLLYKTPSKDSQDTLLFTAIESRDIEMVEFIIEQGSNPNTMSPSHPGKPVLHCIARMHPQQDPIRRQLMDLLIKVGANVNRRDSQGNTLLHLVYYILQLGPDYIEKLLNLGIDVNMQDNRGNTPLNSILNINTQQSPWAEQIALLYVKYGAKLDIPNKSGTTPMDRLNAKPKLILKQKILDMLNI